MNSAELRRNLRSRFALEIAVALCIKTVLLYLLWAAFFSHPASKQLTERRVAADLFGPATKTTASSHSEAPHGSRP